MRPMAIPAALFAVTLAFATPALAQTSQTGTGSSGTHATPPAAMSHGTSAPMSGAAGQKPQEFKTEAQAKSACGTQKVVWANPSSHVLHTSGSKYFGKTKHGAYMCENAAMKAGYHMAKGGQ